MSDNNALIALCSCGRPLGHTGRHVGHKPAPHAQTPRPAHGKLRAMLDSEMKAAHARKAALMKAVQEHRAEIADIDRRLIPMAALLDAYCGRAGVPVAAVPVAAVERIAAPDAPPARPLPARAPVPRLNAPPAAEEQDEDWDPIEVSFDKVQAWAQVRNLAFKGWDDLPAINQRREEYQLPLFKRKLTK